MINRKSAEIAVNIASKSVENVFKNNDSKVVKVVKTAQVLKRGQNRHKIGP